MIHARQDRAKRQPKIMATKAELRGHARVCARRFPLGLAGEPPTNPAPGVEMLDISSMKPHNFFHTKAA